MRDLKGTHNYIKKQTCFEIIKTALLFAMALGIFFIGYYTLGTKKSLWSVLAVLALLPASKSLVGVIMFLRYRSISEDRYLRLSACVKQLPALYENILTTSEKSFYLPVIIYAKGSFIALLDSDNKDKRKNIEKITQHIQNVLKNGGYKDFSVKIFDREEDFIDRCNQMNENFSDEKSFNSNAVLSTIKAVSL